MTLLDHSIIAEVRETLGDDAYRGFVTRMLAEADSTAAELSRLLARGDLGGVVHLSHRSAGSAVAVGASGLHGCLKAIEDEARATAPAGLAALVVDLVDVIARTRAELSQTLGQA